ncbi:hypothetical protein ACLX1H_009217 [Fusarium chlamydosporum]
MTTVGALTSPASSRGRGPRAAGWFKDYLDQQGDYQMKSLVLSEGITGWAKAGVIQDRDNQRRSRARRRQHFEQLQQRLQNYEHRGPQASTEMRHVAKGVLWENKHLHDLLRMHGVSQDEIDHHFSQMVSAGTDTNLNLRKPPQKRGHLRTPRELKRGTMEPQSPNMVSITTHSHDAVDEPSNTSASLSNISLPVPNQRLATSSVDIAEADFTITNSHKDEEHNSYDQRTMQIPERTSISFMCNNDLPDSASHADILPPVTDCFCPPSSPVPITGHWNSRMSCQAAVDIISGLESMVDLEKVRDLLQCEDPNDCLVGNSDVFQILDELA